MTMLRGHCARGCVFACALGLAVGLLGCKRAAEQQGGGSGGVQAAQVAGSSGLGNGTGGAAAGSGATPTATAGSSAGGGSGIAGTLATGSSGRGTPGATGGATTAGAGAVPGAGGASGTPSAAGAGGSANAGTGAGVTPEQCQADVMAAGTTVTDCERCLCQVDTCQPELAAIKGDAKANALVNCTRANMCSGQCCLCATNGKGDVCDSVGANFATGKCANEIQTAAGATPGGDLLTNAPLVMMHCTDTGPDPSNPCTKSSKLAKCASDKCAAMCPSVAVSCP